jgi:hypothetical protein
MVIFVTAKCFGPFSEQDASNRDMEGNGTAAVVRAIQEYVWRYKGNYEQPHVRQSVPRKVTNTLSLE